MKTQTENWHNPANAPTPPAGYRYLTRAEVDEIRSQNAIVSNPEMKAWNGCGWTKHAEGFFGAALDITYILPKENLVNKSEEEIKALQEELRSRDFELAEAKKNSQWAFLKACKLVVMENPWKEEDPEGMQPRFITFEYGKSRHPLAWIEGEGQVRVALSRKPIKNITLIQP